MEKPKKIVLLEREMDLISIDRSINYFISPSVMLVRTELSRYYRSFYARSIRVGIRRCSFRKTVSLLESLERAPIAANRCTISDRATIELDGEKRLVFVPNISFPRYWIRV